VYSGRNSQQLQSRRVRTCVTYQKIAMFKVTATKISDMACLKATFHPRSEMPYSDASDVGSVQDKTVGYEQVPAPLHVNTVFTQICLTPQRSPPLNWLKVIITTCQMHRYTTSNNEPASDTNSSYLINRESLCFWAYFSFVAPSLH
jgi:hypothetical protein